MSLRKHLLLVAAALVLVRGATIYAYRDTRYYYGMVANQFAIADSAFHGHGFGFDKALFDGAQRQAAQENRFLPLEEWRNLNGSGHYETFPALDLPGYGYLIAFTSKRLAGELTAAPAQLVQVAVELAAVLAFCFCVARAFSRRVGLLAGMLYVLAYPFIWPVASLPLRDMFVLGTYGAYIAAFFFFLGRRDRWSNLAVAFLIGLASLLLWFRPTAYYYFFFAAPLSLLAWSQPLRRRLGMTLASVTVPLLVFALPLRSFNLRHYGMADTDVPGKVLWEAMGIIPNPYGFVLDDGAVVPWAKSRGLDDEYGSPALNHALGDYARDVIRKDPWYYVRTVLARCRSILEAPLGVHPFSPSLLFDPSSGAPPGRAAVLWNIGSTLYGRIFFFGGCLALLLMLARVASRRLELLVLASPLVYTLATQLFLHFEQRYLATGAWVLVLPLAWGMERAFSATTARMRRARASVGSTRPGARPA